MDPIAADTPPQIPLDSFTICAFSRHRKIEAAYTIMSLVYGETFPNLTCFRTVALTLTSQDSLVFFVMLYLAARARKQFGMPSLLCTIVRDATVYFLVIFSAHFILAMTILFAKVSPTPHSVNCDRTKRFI